MATSRLSVEIKSRWWLPVYIKTLTLLCLMMRCEPDYQKVGNFIVKYGISQKLKCEPVNR
ncbi:hypothetical protein EFJ13_12625 [Salmonella enterica]|uniref:Uncharacterized protein n=1 Tax=Salmonella enterica subsp. enterica serovar Saintpaul TaxID=90105 RepID=A0A5W5JRA7_SALET|nr:hypothetical protein [Salmonella enterica]EBX1943179.1 hypothetical protein [Salmonella enterica subsp. enterica serovar Saintpaul]EAT8462381.1 hypothetical protein [Salmonella enterica]EAW5279951.1 hypothetical protein [Salmonella enterica]EBN2770846.1 hypothetical protein [Salmonella enterica]